jgi:hypothetical protein
MNSFLDSQLAQSAVRDTAARGSPVNQRNTINPVHVIRGVGFNTQARVVPAVLEKITWQ